MGAAESWRRRSVRPFAGPVLLGSLLQISAALRFSPPVRCTTPHPPASCPGGASWSAAEAAAREQHPALQSPTESLAMSSSMPPVKFYRALGSPITTPHGTHVQYGIVCFAGDHTPVWSHSDVPSSSVAHVSRDGTNWTYTATIASARDFPWSGEGANEGGAALMSDEKTVVVAMRMGGGDYSPAAACLGFFDYHLSRSSDGGLSWSFPEPILGAGAAMPNLQRVGKSLVLSGGRMCGNATSDIFLWLNRDGMARADGFEPFSLSYWHDALLSNATCNASIAKEPCRFDQGVNTSCRTETYAGTRLVNFDNITGAVFYGIHGQYFSMNFTLDGTRSEPGLLRHIPAGSGDKSNCISAHEDMIAAPFNSSVARHTAQRLPLAANPRVTTAVAEVHTMHESNRAIALPTISRVCTNFTTKGSSRHPSRTTCINSTVYPTDGGLLPLILVGDNFSGSELNVSIRPTCRIDPYHGASIHVHKGENPNAYDMSDNHVTFPATILNQTHAVCSPPPKVFAPGAGLLRLSVDNITWPGTSGVDGFPVSYFSLLDVALGKRPYYSGNRSTAGCPFTRQCGDDIAHLLVRTNCLAMGETIGHDLCQQQPRVNATLAGTGLAWQWTMIAGDRALPFNVSSLPPSVHNDLHVTVSYGAYTAHRVLRFSRVPRPDSTTTRPVQVDHFTKTLSIDGESWLGSGHYFGSFSGDDLLRLVPSLPQMVRRGINMGVMLTLPSANRSVERAFFSASAEAGFKIVYPAFIFDNVGANLTNDVRRLANEPALLGWYICDDCCKSHTFISTLARGYTALKAIDKYHPTFGSVNCDSPWLFSDNPSFLPVNRSASSAPILPAGAQPASQLSLDVPLIENYGSIGGQMGTGSWAQNSPKRDGDFRNGIPFGPIGNMLSYSGHFEPAATMMSGLWLGVVTAELYYSAGWIAVPSANLTAKGYSSAVSKYAEAVAELQPHTLGRFGNTRLSVEMTNNVTLRSRAWFDAENHRALVVVVNGGGQPVKFSGKVLQAFNPRMVFATFNASVGAASTSIHRLSGAQPAPTPPPRAAPIAQ